MEWRADKTPYIWADPLWTTESDIPAALTALIYLRYVTLCSLDHVLRLHIHLSQNIMSTVKWVHKNQRRSTSNCINSLISVSNFTSPLHVLIFSVFCLSTQRGVTWLLTSFFSLSHNHLSHRDIGTRRKWVEWQHDRWCIFEPEQIDDHRQD